MTTEHATPSSSHSAESLPTRMAIAPCSLSAFFRLRLRYLLHAGKARLMQRWLVLLVTIFLSPALPIVALLVRAAHFMVFLFATPGVFPQAMGLHLGAMAFAQISALLWVEGLRPILRGGPFRGYLDSLPIPLSKRLTIAAGLAFLLDLPLLLPLPVGLVLIGLKAPMVVLLYIMRGLVFTGLTIMVQAARIEAAPVLVPFIMMADAALAMACGMAASGAALPMLALPVLIAGAGLSLSARLGDWNGAGRYARRVSSFSLKGLSRLNPILRLQIRCCIERGNTTSGVMLIVWVLPVALWALLYGFDYDLRSIPVEIVAMGLIAQGSLVPFAALAEAHERASGFCLALPLPRFFWVRSDIGLVLALFVIPGLLCLVPLVLHGLISLLGAFLVLASYLLLVSALRATIPIDPRWRPMPALALSALWISVILFGAFA